MAEREGKGVSSIDEAGNAFAIFNNQWVSYDTQSTVLEKVSFYNFKCSKVPIKSKHILCF